MISEEFKVTHNRLFEWESDKARVVYDKRRIRFSVVSSMLLTADSHLVVPVKEKAGEQRIRTFGLAKDGKHYIYVYTKRNYGSEDIGNGQKFHPYHPITAKDIRVDRELRILS